jgi:hypothetical protein
MAEKFTVEKGQGLKDLKEISKLRKEKPDKLIARAFKEWVRIREDMEDIAIAEKEIAAYERDGKYYTEEDVFGPETPPREDRRARKAPVRRTRASRVRA